MKSLIPAALTAIIAFSSSHAMAESSNPTCEKVRAHFVAVGVDFVSGYTPSADTVAALKYELQVSEDSCDFISVVQMNEMLVDFEAAVAN
jgi:hypothetical protein